MDNKDKIIKEIRELQETELSILLDVDKVCREHGIKYFLGEGTLLGAIRHKGFIPWDDDVDIIMMRSDYERFLKIAPEILSPRYEVQHYTTVDSFWSPFIKVRLLDENQKYGQQHIAHLSSHNGAYIDVFPMEYVTGKNDIKVKMQSFKIRYYRGILSLKLGLREPKNAKQRVLKVLSHLYSVDKLHKNLNCEFNRYNNEKSEFVGTLASYHKLKCQIVAADTYDESIEWDFEGHKLPVPKNYDYLLKTIYGDYMTLPPEEERYIKHHFDEVE